MHVQVLKRYRDRDTKTIHEVGELVEYDNIPRIVVLSRGGYVEPLEPLPADTETEPATNVLTATVNSEDLKITMDHLNKVPAGSVHVVTAADLESNPELVNTGVKEGDTITLGPDGSTIPVVVPPVVTQGFSQVANSTGSDPVMGELTTGTNDLPPATDPAGQEKGGKPASAKTPAKKSTKKK